jgi:hypothetical protein
MPFSQNNTDLFHQLNEGCRQMMWWHEMSIIDHAEMPEKTKRATVAGSPLAYKLVFNYLSKRFSTAAQSTLDRKDSMYFGLSAGL